MEQTRPKLKTNLDTNLLKLVAGGQYAARPLRRDLF